MQDPPTILTTKGKYPKVLWDPIKKLEIFGKTWRESSFFRKFARFSNEKTTNLAAEFFHSL